MADTIAVQLDYLARMNRTSGPTGQPLCPSCRGGRLHPYLVTFNLTEIPGRGWHGPDGLTGWVAVCVGNESYVRAVQDQAATCGEAYEAGPGQSPCGFSMPMTPHLRP